MYFQLNSKLNIHFHSFAQWKQIIKMSFPSFRLKVSENTVPLFNNDIPHTCILDENRIQTKLNLIMCGFIQRII